MKSCVAETLRRVASQVTRGFCVTTLSGTLSGLRVELGGGVDTYSCFSCSVGWTACGGCCGGGSSGWLEGCGLLYCCGRLLKGFPNGRVIEPKYDERAVSSGVVTAGGASSIAGGDCGPLEPLPLPSRLRALVTRLCAALALAACARTIRRDSSECRPLSETMTRGASVRREGCRLEEESGLSPSSESLGRDIGASRAHVKRPFSLISMRCPVLKCQSLFKWSRV